MSFRSWIFLILVISSGCSKLSNSHREQELRCGTQLDSSQFLVMPIDGSGQSLSPERLRATRVSGRETVELPLTVRGCVILDRSLAADEALIITAQDNSQVSGAILDKAGSESFVVPLQALPRSDVSLNCPTNLTLRDQIVFPINKPASWDSRFLRVNVRVEGSNDPSFPALSLLPSDGESLQLALNAQDGAEITVKLKLMNFLKPRSNSEQELSCKVKVDRTAPDVAVVLGSSDPASDFLNPGEPVFFRVSETSRVYYCWQKMEGSESCTYKLWASDANAPSSGPWQLKYYAEDGAGNRSAVKSIQKLITVASEIEAIEGIYAAANFQLEQGAALKALDTFITAEKRRQQLPGEAERKTLQGAADDILRKAAFYPGPRDEIQVAVGLSGLIMNPNGQIFLTYNPFGVAQLWDIQGRLLKTLSSGTYGEVKDAEWNEPGTYFVTKNRGDFVPSVVEVWTAAGEKIARVDEKDGLKETFSDSGMAKKVHFIPGRTELAIPQATSLVIYDFVKKSKREIAVPDGLRGYRVTPSGREIYISSGTISPNNLTIYKTDDLSARPFGSTFGRITALEFTKDESQLAIVQDSEVRLYGPQGVLQWAKRFNLQTWGVQFIDRDGRAVALQLNSFNASRLVDLEGRVITGPEAGSDHSKLFQLNGTEWIGSTSSRLYKYNSSTEALSYLSAQEGISLITTLPSSSTVLIGYQSGQVALWDKKLIELEYNSELIQRVPLAYTFSAQFTPGSRSILHCGYTGPFTVLTLDDLKVRNYGTLPSNQTVHDERCVYDEERETVSYVTRDLDKQTVHTIEKSGSTREQSYPDADVILSADGVHRAVRRGTMISFYKGQDLITTQPFSYLREDAEPRGFQFSSDGEYVLGFADTGLEVWSKSGKKIYKIDKSGNEGLISNDGSTLITTYLGYEFDIYSEGLLQGTVEGGVTGSINPYGLLRSGRSLAVQTSGNILIYDMKNPKADPFKIEERRSGGNLGSQTNGDLLALGYYSDGSAKLWSDRGTLLLNMSRYAGRPAFSLDNNWLIFNGSDQGSTLVRLSPDVIRESYCRRVKAYLTTRHSVEDQSLVCPAQ
jgi:hypothetical protein